MVINVYCVINHLKNERQILIERIRNGEHGEIESKVQVENAISWLEKIMELELKHSNSYDFIKLPDMRTGYSEYHILNDCEIEDMGNWIELKNEEGKPITLIMDDVIIRSK